MSPERLARGLVAGSAILLALLAGGGGGRDPVAALVWQLAALGLLAFASLLAPSAGLRGVRAAVAALAVVVVASALQADRVEAAREQALAWLLALAPAAVVVAAGRRLSGEGSDLAERALAGASVAFLALQALGVWGLPLLGTAGAVTQGRPLGTFLDPNHLAACLSLLAAIHVARAGWTGFGRIHLILAVAAGAGALLTTSRVAVLAVGGLILAEAWRRRRASGRDWPRHARPLAAGLVLVLVSAGAWVAWSRRGDPENWTRTRIWQGAAPALVERPLLGLGPAGFQSEWPRFQQPVERGLSRTARIARTPHGEWLRLPIELGIAGVAAIVVLAGLVLARSGAATQAAPVLAAAAPILLVHDALNAPAFTAWLAMGLALPLARGGGAADEAPPPLRAPRLVVALGLALVAAASWRTQISQRELELSLASGDPRALGRSLALEPGDVEALLWASDLTARASDAAGRMRALSLAEEAARLAPRDAEAALAVARLHASSRRDAAPPAPPDIALEAYERACALAPFDAWRRAEAAAMAIRAGSHEAGLAFAMDALRIEPHLSRGRAWTIVALERLGRKTEADEERRRLRADLGRHAAGVLASHDLSVLEIEEPLLREAGLR